MVAPAHRQAHRGEARRGRDVDELVPHGNGARGIPLSFVDALQHVAEVHPAPQRGGGDPGLDGGPGRTAIRHGGNTLDAGTRARTRADGGGGPCVDGKRGKEQQDTQDPDGPNHSHASHLFPFPASCAHRPADDAARAPAARGAGPGSLVPELPCLPVLGRGRTSSALAKRPVGPAPPRARPPAGAGSAWPLQNMASETRSRAPQRVDGEGSLSRCSKEPSLPSISRRTRPRRWSRSRRRAPFRGRAWKETATSFNEAPFRSPPPTAKSH